MTVNATADVIVIGVGGVGSAATFHLARRGASVIGLDRFPPGHDRGSSHGHTRLIRMAYFEHPDYVPLLRRAFELWEELEALTGERLYRQTGLLEVGCPDGEVVAGVKRSAAEHNLAIEVLQTDEIVRRFPGLRATNETEGVFEERAGLLYVEHAVRTHAEWAGRAGARFEIGPRVLGWEPDGQAVRVRTDRGDYLAGHVVVTAGPWAGELLRQLGVPLKVLRKPLYWRGAPPIYDADAGCPAFLFERPEGVFYGFPSVDERGVKVAEHSGGAAVADPATVDRTEDFGETGRIDAFLKDHLPGVSGPATGFAVCLYTMSPDGHFLIDRFPGEDRVHFVAGLSGHGFKFAGVLGEILADRVIDGRTRHPVEFLSWERFADAGRAAPG